MNDLRHTLEAARMHAQGTITVDDYSLLSGITITVGADTITEGVDFAAATDNDTTATNIAAAIDALTGVNAAAVDNVVTINADAVGTAGNAKVLETDAADGLTLSGATLEGGAAALYTDVFTMDEGLDEIEMTLAITALSGGSPTVDVTPQVSNDGGTTWIDAELENGSALVFPQKTGTGTDQLYMKRAAKKNRCKIVLGGTSPVVTGSIYMNGRRD